MCELSEEAFDQHNGFPFTSAHLKCSFCRRQNLQRTMWFFGCTVRTSQGCQHSIPVRCFLSSKLFPQVEENPAACPSNDFTSAHVDHRLQQKLIRWQIQKTIARLTKAEIRRRFFLMGFRGVTSIFRVFWLILAKNRLFFIEIDFFRLF